MHKPYLAMYHVEFLIQFNMAAEHSYIVKQKNS